MNRRDFLAGISATLAAPAVARHAVASWFMPSEPPMRTVTYEEWARASLRALEDQQFMEGLVQRYAETIFIYGSAAMTVDEDGLRIVEPAELLAP